MVDLGPPVYPVVWHVRMCMIQELFYIDIYIDKDIDICIYIYYLHADFALSWPGCYGIECARGRMLSSGETRLATRYD